MPMRLPDTPGAGPIQLMNGRSAYDCAMSLAPKVAQETIAADADRLVATVSDFIAAHSKSSDDVSQLKIASLSLMASCPESKKLAESLLVAKFGATLPINLVIGVR